MGKENSKARVYVLENLVSESFLYTRGRPGFLISRYLLTSWISCAIFLEDGIFNIVSYHFKSSISHKIKKKNCVFVNNHQDHILLNLWWETFPSYFEKHRKRFVAKDRRANSTKKKYVPSPTMPLCSPSSHYIQHNGIHLWHIVGKNYQMMGKRTRGEEEKAGCPTFYMKITSQGGSNFSLYPNVFPTTLKAFFKNSLPQIWNLKEKKKKRKESQRTANWKQD